MVLSPGRRHPFQARDMAPKLPLLLLGALVLSQSCLIPHHVQAAGVRGDYDIADMEGSDPESSSDAVNGMFDFKPFEDGPEDGGEEEDLEYDDDDVIYDDEEEVEAFEDDGDVITLVEANFSETVSAHENILVEFYAPWCGHCKELAPHYREAASLLKVDGVALAKVDAEAEAALGDRHEVQGFPTILFFSKGISQPYTGGRQSDDIVEWVRKKLGPSVATIKDKGVALEALESEPAIAVVYFDKLEGPEYEEFQQAAKLEDGLFMAQTSRREVADAFGFPADVARPCLLVLKDEEERRVVYEGPFEATALRQFMAANRSPLVLTYNEGNSEKIFGGPITRQVLLFATSKQIGGLLAPFQEVAKHFKGKILFVYGDTSNEVTGSLTEFFGATSDSPMVLAFDTQGEGKKHLLKGEISADSLNSFTEEFLEGTLEPYFKSDPVPEQDDSGVTVVVGKTFEEIVCDPSKDVLLEVHAPWCGHCQKLEPVYRRLGLRFQSVPSVVIAQMDGTTNEHPNITVEGFPTIFFYPSNNKTEPTKVDVTHKLKPLTEFLKEHASIPFRLPKRGELLETRPDDSVAEDVDGLRGGGSMEKDEL